LTIVRRENTLVLNEPCSERSRRKTVRKSIALPLVLALAALAVTTCRTGTPNIALYDVTSVKTQVNVGDTINFGTAYIFGNPTSVTHSFSIENSGDATLALTGTGAKIVISGADASNYSIPTQPPASIPPGGSVGFDVVFTPSTSGSPVTRNAAVGLASDDPDLSAISFNVTGTDQYS
jgi:hypothetical protein